MRKKSFTRVSLILNKRECETDGGGLESSVLAGCVVPSGK